MSTAATDKAILSQFQLENGTLLGGPVEIPLIVNTRQLNSVANGLAQAQKIHPNDTNDPIPYSFYVDDVEIKESLEIYFQEQTNKQMFEKTLNILCVPKARFQVIPVERCTATIEGHLEAITSLQFSPNGKLLASGSGDTTVRFWDLNTQTPFDEYGKAHKHWILCLSWAPNGKMVASSCKDGLIGLWIGATGKQHGKNPANLSLSFDFFFFRDEITLRTSSMDQFFKLATITFERRLSSISIR